MILRDYLNENKVRLSNKGILAMAKAIKDVLSVDKDLLFLNRVSDIDLVRYVLGWDLKEEDCLKIMQLTSRYAKLWLFA